MEGEWREFEGRRGREADRRDGEGGEGNRFPHFSN
jgi:hypothetical protein